MNETKSGNADRKNAKEHSPATAHLPPASMANNLLTAFNVFVIVMYNLLFLFAAYNIAVVNVFGVNE